MKFRSQAVAVAGLLLAVGSAVAPAAPALAGPVGTPYEMISLINQDRARAGIAPVAVNGALMSIAQWRSNDMMTRNYFSHYYNGTAMLDLGMSQHHLQALAWGENIDENNYPVSEAGDSMVLSNQDFMNSPEHRAIILNPRYTQVGVAFAKTSQGLLYVTEDFMQPVGSPPPPPHSNPSHNNPPSGGQRQAPSAPKQTAPSNNPPATRQQAPATTPPTGHQSARTTTAPATQPPAAVKKTNGGSTPGATTISGPPAPTTFIGLPRPGPVTVAGTTSGNSGSGARGQPIAILGFLALAAGLAFMARRTRQPRPQPASPPVSLTSYRAGRTTRATAERESDGENERKVA